MKKKCHLHKATSLKQRKLAVSPSTLKHRESNKIGRQENKFPMRKQDKILENDLKDKATDNLSDKELKVMVIK